jgi:hypothetical protein
MPDLTKHLSRAKQLADKGASDDAMTILGECIDIDPANVEIYRVLILIARRRFKETGGKTGLFGLGGFKMPVIGNDPLKLFAACAKQVGKTGDPKAIAAALEAAVKLSATLKGMGEVAIVFGEEFKVTGLFNDKVLWHLAHMYFERYTASGKKDETALDKALTTMGVLEKAMPNHAEAGRTLKNWMAMQSMGRRAAAAGSSGTGDYRWPATTWRAARKC